MCRWVVMGELRRLLRQSLSLPQRPPVTSRARTFEWMAALPGRFENQSSDLIRSVASASA